MIWKPSPARTGLLIWILLGVLGLIVIVITSANVVRDLKLLNSARSDNVQWTLSQAEVEFLEFRLSLEVASRSTLPDLVALRRDFDIFYSRITTLRVASVYGPLRKTTEFTQSLTALQRFLNQSVPLIDAEDLALRLALPSLLQTANPARERVRELSTSGLDYFAQEADRMRSKVAITLTQMAAGVAFLILVLLILALFLGRLNRQNIRRRREAIETSERMNVVTSTALDGVIVADNAGNIVEFNTAAEQIFGYKAQEAIGQNLSLLLGAQDLLVAQKEGLRQLQGSTQKWLIGTGRVHLEAKRANGDSFPIEMALQLAKTENGEVYVAFVRDISHRVAAETELVAARDRALAGEKAKTEFLATMSHEIRTPLNGLLGNLSLLNDTQLSPQQRRYCANMDTSGKLLLSHISDVLDITKYETGNLTLRPVAMNLGALVQDIVDNQGGAAASNRTSLDWSWKGAAVAWIYADIDRLQHVLMNVIGNAVKFTHNGAVNVVLEPIADASEIEITIRDTGIGIAPEMLETIFDDFVTGDSSYGRDFGGTGLGLGLARRFVTALGGTISVTSTLGAGSTFHIRLPVQAVEAPEEAKVDPAKDAPSVCSHVLLVEDNQINRVVAREMLRAAGHQVTEAHNGREAVELAQGQAFDLILMDISMPVLDGRGATREIRAGQGACAKVPIVALTANAMPEEQKAYLEDGMNDVLTKPLSRASLLRIVGSFGGAGTGIVVQVAAVDVGMLKDLRETLGAEMYVQLLARFKSEANAAIDELSAQPMPSKAEIAALAHRTAGSASYFGALDLRKAFVAVEEAARRGDDPALGPAIAALPAIWLATQGSLGT